MNICDLIIDIDEMKRNNREYSRLHDRNEDCQREDNAADLAMEIMNGFTRLGAKNTEAAIMFLKIYPALLDENKRLKYELEKPKYGVSRLKEGTKISILLLRTAKIVLNAYCESDICVSLPKKDLKDFLATIADTLNELEKLL